jgi:hypothetical protein
MLSLRALALASNVCFLIFGLLHAHFDITQLIGMPEIILNAILLPVNAKRLGEILRLTKQIEQATVESPVSEWLLPHMHLKKHKAGEVLLRKGDKPTRFSTWRRDASSSRKSTSTSRPVS